MDTIQDNEKALSKNYDEKAPNNSDIAPKVNYTYLTLFCIIVALSGLPVGWDIGTIGYIINTSTFKETYGNSVNGETGLSSFMVGVIISSFNMGCLMGCLGLSRLTVRLGFKSTIFISNLIYLLGSCTQIMAGFLRLSVWIMIAGRISCGICCGTLCVLVPRYLNQLIVVPQKDIYLSFFQTSVCTAILGGNLANFALQQDYLKIVSGQVLIIIVTTSLAVFLPESYQYYVSRNEQEKANIVLRKLHYQISEEQIVNLIGQEAIINKLPKGWIWNKQYYEPLIQCCMMMVFQQFTGINYFFYYGSIIFSSLGINTALVSIIMSVVNLVGSLTSNVIIGKFGRIKLLLMIGSATMSILLTSYVALAFITTPTALTCMVIITCLFIASFAITWGPIPGILIARISNNSNEIIGLANCVNYTINCLITIVTPIMINIMGFNFSILFIITLISLIFYIYYMSIA